MAAANLKRQEERENAHCNRPNSFNPSTSILPPPNTKNHATTRTMQIDYFGTESKKVVTAVNLNNMSHIYISLDGDIKPEDKFRSFQNVISNQKITEREKLGTSCIKIYGLNAVFVKSKEFPAEHLICIVHKIEGTNDYVCLPYQLTAHRNYENLIRNKAQLDALNKKVRESLSVKYVDNKKLEEKQVVHSSSYKPQ